MKKETCVALLKLLKENHIDIGKRKMSLEKILNLPQNIVEEILKAKNINNNKIERIYYYLYTLSNYEISDNKTLLEGVKVLAECTEEGKIPSHLQVLCSPLAIEAGIALEGSKIVANCNDGSIAKCCAAVLSNENAIKAGIALEGTKIIAACEEEWLVNNIALVLTNSNALKAAIALEGSKIIAGCKEEWQASNIAKVLTDFQATQEDVALEGSKIIANCTSHYNAECCLEVLCDSKALEQKIALEGALLISKAKDDVHTFGLRELYTNIELGYIRQTGLTTSDFVLYIEKAVTKEEAEEIVKISSMRYSDSTQLGARGLLEKYIGYTLFDGPEIDQLSVEQALLMLNHEQFKFPEEISGETVKEFIKKNNRQKHLLKNGN